MAKKKIRHHLMHHLRRAHEHVRDHFVPHERNNYKPHALKHHVLVGYSVILILLKVLVIVAPIALPSSSLYSSAITPQNIIDLTNQARQNLGLPTLSINQKLMTAAADKADDMLTNQYFAHTSPAGVSPWDWFTKVGYSYLYAGENLAVHFLQAEDVQAGWMASPTHRANIVNPNYTEIGVGVSNGTFEGVPSTFVVQEFGQPFSSTAIASQPAPAPTSNPVVASAPTTKANVQTVPVVSTPPSGAATKPTTKPEGVTTTPAPSAPSTIPLPIHPSTEPTPTSANVPAANPTPPPTTEQTILADTSQPLVQKVVSNPVIDESSFVATPVSGGYHIRLAVSNASSVTVTLGDAKVSLAPLGQSNLWDGVLTVQTNAIADGGESLTALAVNDNGGTTSSALALIAPNTETQQLYIFNEGTSRFTTLLGFLHISNLNDSVRRFYIEFTVFLAAALLIYLFASRVTLRRFGLVGHAIGVMTLALVLFIL